MRLGLIGTGKQGQRYLLEKNGGRHIKVSGSRRIPLDDVDGVIIATHPAGHKELALECIAAGKAVLIEKPLALNLADCEEILDAAERAGVLLKMANPYITSMDPFYDYADAISVAAFYQEHTRDYSPWLDWGPHLLSIAAFYGPDEMSTAELRRSVEVVFNRTLRGIYVAGEGAHGRWRYMSWDPMAERFDRQHTPMSKLVDAFVEDAPHWSRHSAEDRTEHLEFHRRVYRALFAED